MIQTLFSRCLLLLAACAVCNAALGAERVLQCEQLLDVDRGQPAGPHVIVIRDGVIQSVAPGRTSDDDQTGEVIESGGVCLPGLMDMHTHLSFESSPQAYLERFVRDPAEIALKATVHARRTLEAGFTTVRDLGDTFNVSVALRDAIAAGWVPGPRIYTSAKSLATTGGHADPTNGWRHDLMGRPGPAEGVLNGPAQAREAVRQRYKDRADLIKITVTGGVLSVASSGLAPQFLPDELDAVVQTARDYGMHVAAHAHGKEGMLRAIRAGVHSIEHGTMMDDEVIQAMIEHQTWYVPTILAGRFVAEKAEIDGYFPEIVRLKARKIGPLIQTTFARAHAAGVKIAFGTDSGVSPHGQNAREFALMVEAGMTPIEAIRAATLRAAELLGIERQAGRIAPGYWADIIAVADDPLKNVRTLEQVVFVMKGGKVYKRP
ncbi:MAG: amidohydrolase family protein [Wenzhouxiangellaceae bacterium]